ncbi:MAG: hypothetical protein WCC87_05205 [Candidatus Korobacteraceae bacterium]
MRKLKGEQETENARYRREEIEDLHKKALMMVGNLVEEATEDPEEKVSRAVIPALGEKLGYDSVKDAAREFLGTGTDHRYNKHVAEVTLLEGFDLGKNTAQNAGIEIKVFNKGAGKRGPQLGTIRIGQGSFKWWARSAKTRTTKGKGKATVSVGWFEFADLMEEINRLRKRGRRKRS